MKGLLVLGAVAAVVWLLFGSAIRARVDGLNEVAKSSERNIEAATRALQRAGAANKAAGAGGNPSTAWTDDANAACLARDDALRRLPAPTTSNDFAPYVRRGIKVLRRHDAKVLAVSAPPEALTEVRELRRTSIARLELLRAALAAAERGDTSAFLDEVEGLRTLARRVNPELVRARLLTCRLPSWGIPLT